MLTAKKNRMAGRGAMACLTARPIHQARTTPPPPEVRPDEPKILRHRALHGGFPPLMSFSGCRCLSRADLPTVRRSGEQIPTSSSFSVEDTEATYSQYAIEDGASLEWYPDGYHHAGGTSSRHPRSWLRTQGVAGRRYVRRSSNSGAPPGHKRHNEWLSSHPHRGTEGRTHFLVREMFPLVRVA